LKSTEVDRQKPMLGLSSMNQQLRAPHPETLKNGD
jgi:hypothetical protein